jgi:hypothetical protein
MVSQIAMDPGQGALMLMFSGMLVGLILGFVLKMPFFGLLLGVFGLPGWIATVIVYFFRKREPVLKS